MLTPFWIGISTQSRLSVWPRNPTTAIIDLAIVHTAIYDAVNAIAGSPFEPYEVTPIVTVPASPEAAAATAGHDTLVALFPAQQADLDTKYAASLAQIPDGPAKTNGIAVGQQTAAGILALRADDGRNDVVPYTPGSGPGVWVPTPPGFLPTATPQVAQVLPWTLDSPDQFRAPGPPKLTSKRWAREYNEVKALGGATGSTRTPEQTDIARFWSENPFVQWNRTWRGISINTGLSLEENARFFAVLATVYSDAYIACWDSKYYYNFWRPVTAIPVGDTDGNPKTAPDSTWLSLLVTPNHPEYPSGHSCAVGAITITLKRFFGTDTFTFKIDSTVPASQTLSTITRASPKSSTRSPTRASTEGYTIAPQPMTGSRSARKSPASPPAISSAAQNRKAARVAEWARLTLLRKRSKAKRREDLAVSTSLIRMDQGCCLKSQ